MSFGDVNIDDFSFELTSEVAKLVPQSESGNLMGREILPTEENSTKISFQKDLVKKVVEHNFSLLKGKEVSFAHTSILQDKSASLSQEKIKSMGLACRAIIGYLDAKAGLVL